MKFHHLALSLVTLSLAGTTPVVFAQDDAAPKPENHERKGPRGRMSPEQRVAGIEKAVGDLTADQKAKILDILNKARDKAQALAPEERREKGAEIMKDANDQIRAVLTAEQQPKYDEMLKKFRGGEGRGGEGHGGDHEHKQP
jgi:Spy/CpxP family protein refolding chaperone